MVCILSQNHDATINIFIVNLRSMHNAGVGRVKDIMPYGADNHEKLLPCVLLPSIKQIEHMNDHFRLFSETSKCQKVRDFRLVRNLMPRHSCSCVEVKGLIVSLLSYDQYSLRN